MQKDRFTRWVGHGIIGPGGQLVFAAVLGPDMTTAKRGHLKAETGVGNDIDPRGRRALTAAQDGDVFASMVGKATNPVEELKL